MEQLYIKNGKRYKPVRSDWSGFPCDGIWLVQSKPNGKSAECVLKIGEVPSLYPFANMVVNKDDLANFLVEEFKNKISANELALKILKFLAREENDKNT